MTTALPFQAQQPIFEKMGGISELRHMSPEDRNRYMYSLNKYRTNLSVMKNEREEGREEGRAEGLAKGREKGLAEGIAKGHKKGLAEGREKGRAEGRSDLENEMVMRMLSLGMGAKEIANILGIEIDKVELILAK